MPTKTKKAAKDTAVHVVAGNDEMAVKARAKELAAELAPAEGGEFAVETIDAHADNAEHGASIIREAILSLSMPGFLAAEKLVWLKSANFLSDTQLGGSKTVLEALEDLQKILESGLPDGTRLLFSAISPDKRRTFYKALTKLASTDVLDKPSGGPRFDEDEAARQAATAAASFSNSATASPAAISNRPATACKNSSPKAKNPSASSTPPSCPPSSA